MNRKYLTALSHDRPLACFDLEATGTSPRGDRIVEICMIKVFPDGAHDTMTRRINPGMPIPPAAIAIHGITDADVATCPTFAELAPTIDAFLEGCDLAGFNCSRYDIPMLMEEFLRAGMTFDISARRVVDAQVIYHNREPRNLAAAVAFYCDRTLEDAHGAEADARATLEVIEGQLERYAELPRDIEALDAFCNPRDPDWVDRTGRLKWHNGVVVLNFGAKKGLALSRLIENEPKYIKWLLRSDFPRDVLEIVEQATMGVWPEPPERDA